MGKRKIAFELDFLNKKLSELEEYINNRPLTDLEDRTDVKGRTVATVEKQREDIFKSIKEYTEIVEKVEKLRLENEEATIEKRGGGEFTFVERMLMDRKNKENNE